ncbi:MAG: flagellar hook-length control protein FliK, partial [Bacillota bacterium]|nr:flagellar hook-length control protein FliK [Bacillota bacterium]
AAVAAAVQYPFSTGERADYSPLDLGALLAALVEELKMWPADGAGKVEPAGGAPAPSDSAPFSGEGSAKLPALSEEIARAAGEVLVKLDRFLQEPEGVLHLPPVLQRAVQALGLLRAPLQHLLEAGSQTDSAASPRAGGLPPPSDLTPPTPPPLLTSARWAAVQQLAEQALANLTAQQVASQPPAQSGAPHFLYLQLPLLINGQPQTAELAIRVRRDEQGRPAVDPEKMHIICRLSTRHLGVVQVELLAAGRSLDVRLEAETPEVEALFREREEDLRELVERAGYQPGEVSFRTRSRRQRSALPPLELQLTSIDLRL